MWALVKREWFVFFSTPLGYLTLFFFLTLSNLFLWFLDTDFNLKNYQEVGFRTYRVTARPLLRWSSLRACLSPHPQQQQNIKSQTATPHPSPQSSAIVYHGLSRFGSLGKSDVFRMFGSPQKSMTTRSRPMPPPPCGNAPYLNESTYAMIGLRSTGGSFAAAWSRSICGSWIRCAPEVTSSPRMKVSYELERVGSIGSGIV